MWIDGIGLGIGFSIGILLIAGALGLIYLAAEWYRGGHW